MNKKTKILIFSVIVFSFLSFVWFNFIFLKINGEYFENELMKAGKESNVIIVFNSGGWGTVPFDKAFDFNPIINETKKIIESHNYKVSIVQYYRTEDTFFAKIASLGEVLFNFPDSSKVFVGRLNKFLKENPDDKIIMAGLSNGASFVDAVMDDLNNNNNVLAIELGRPFWKKNNKSENILSLNNQADILANGEFGHLLLSMVKTPFVWAYSNISGNHISFTEAMHVDGHNYRWSQVKSQLTSFVEGKL
jgi:hypothetical protein